MLTADQLFLPVAVIIDKHSTGDSPGLSYKIHKYDMKPLLITLALICAANGATIDAKLESLAPMRTTRGTYTGGASTVIYAGILEFSSPTVGPFQAFCIEPTSSISIGESLTYTVTNTVPVELAQLVTLFQQSSRDSLNTIAMQWAVWEVLGDSTQDLSTGLVRMVNSHARTLAEQYLASYSHAVPATGLSMLSNPTRQDMVTVTPIPEPGAVLIGALGFILLLRRRR